MSVDRSMQDFLFRVNQAHDPLSARDAMDAQAEVLGPTMDDSNDSEQCMTIQGLRNQLRNGIHSRRTQLLTRH